MVQGRDTRTGLLAAAVSISERAPTTSGLPFLPKASDLFRTFWGRRIERPARRAPTSHAFVEADAELGPTRPATVPIRLQSFAGPIGCLGAAPARSQLSVGTTSHHRLMLPRPCSGPEPHQPARDAAEEPGTR